MFIGILIHIFPSMLFAVTSCPGLTWRCPQGRLAQGYVFSFFFVIFCVMYSCVFLPMMTTPNTYPCTIPSCLFCFHFGLYSCIASYIQALAYCKDLRYPPPRSSNRAYTNGRSTLSRTNSTSAAGDSNKGRNSRYTLI